jgi:hypothetical protein
MTYWKYLTNFNGSVICVIFLVNALNCILLNHKHIYISTWCGDIDRYLLAQTLVENEFGLKRGRKGVIWYCWHFPFYTAK